MSKYYLEYTPDGIKVRDKTVPDGQPDVRAFIKVDEILQVFRPYVLIKRPANQVADRRIGKAEVGASFSLEEGMAARPAEAGEEFPWVAMTKEELSREIVNAHNRIKALESELADSETKRGIVETELQLSTQTIKRLDQQLAERPVKGFSAAVNDFVELRKRFDKWNAEIGDRKSITHVVAKWLQDCQSVLPAPVQPIGQVDAEGLKSLIFDLLCQVDNDSVLGLDDRAMIISAHVAEWMRKQSPAQPAEPSGQVDCEDCEDTGATCLTCNGPAKTGPDATCECGGLFVYCHCRKDAKPAEQPRWILVAETLVGFTNEWERQAAELVRQTGNDDDGEACRLRSCAEEVFELLAHVHPDMKSPAERKTTREYLLELADLYADQPAEPVEPVTRYVPTLGQLVDFYEHAEKWRRDSNDTRSQGVMISDWLLSDRPALCGEGDGWTAPPAEPPATAEAANWEPTIKQVDRLGYLLDRWNEDENDKRKSADVYRDWLKECHVQPATAEAGSVEEPLPEGYTAIDGYDKLCRFRDGTICPRGYYGHIIDNGCVSMPIEDLVNCELGRAIIYQAATYLIREIASAARLTVTITPTP